MGRAAVRWQGLFSSTEVPSILLLIKCAFSCCKKKINNTNLC